jgi:S1-C subfamily serine protease
MGIAAPLAAALLAAAANVSGPQADDLRSALVKIFTNHQLPSYHRPWNTGATWSGSGSGVIVEGQRILTNAHVVDGATFIQVRRAGLPEKHRARVLYVAHEADLALLAIDDPAFFQGTRPLAVGTLPAMRQEVTVLGFPAGGDTLSVTRGVVSRIEHQSYVHSGRDLLAGQIDAAINPGNSGGPVVSEGRVVGIAMQANGGLDNVAYMIPAPVIQRFLRDVEDGSYDGVPDLGLQWQPLVNPSLRKRYGLPADVTGVLVTALYPGSPAAGALRKHDVLVGMNGHKIADDGTVEFRSGERTSMAHFVDARQRGDSVDLVYFRDGVQRAERVVLAWEAGGARALERERHDETPAYFIFGGVNFVPLCRNFMRSAYGPEWFRVGPDELLAALHEIPSAVGEERVVISEVLAAEVNQGYHELGGEIVEAVDGVVPLNLAHFASLVEHGQGEFVTISHSQGRVLVLDRARARLEGPAILERYGVARDRSAGLVRTIHESGRVLLTNGPM